MQAEVMGQIPMYSGEKRFGLRYLSCLIGLTRVGVWINILEFNLSAVAAEFGAFDNLYLHFLQFLGMPLLMAVVLTSN